MSRSILLESITPVQDPPSPRSPRSSEQRGWRGKWGECWGEWRTRSESGKSLGAIGYKMAAAKDCAPFSCTRVYISEHTNFRQTERFYYDVKGVSSVYFIECSV